MIYASHTPTLSLGLAYHFCVDCNQIEFFSYIFSPSIVYHVSIFTGCVLPSLVVGVLAGYEMVVMHLLWTSSVLGFRFPNTEDLNLEALTVIGNGAF